MFLRLRILFTILSAICIAAFFPVGIFFDWAYAAPCALLALLFFGIMLICKQNQIAQEEKEMKNTTSTENNEEPPSPTEK